MKTKKTSEQSAAPSVKGKVKNKNLKVTKETIETLSDQDAGAIKGGASSGTVVVGGGSKSSG